MAIDEPGSRGMTLSSLDLSLPVNEEKAKEIRACLERGELRIQLAQADLASGRLGDGYKYD
jgi:hypothetical protein